MLDFVGCTDSDRMQTRTEIVRSEPRPPLLQRLLLVSCDIYPLGTLRDARRVDWSTGEGDQTRRRSSQTADDAETSKRFTSTSRVQLDHVDVADCGRSLPYCRVSTCDPLRYPYRPEHF